jgi:glycogen debranching enzyme
MFGKYASRAFNFQGTLDNFYAKQHPDGFICREIRESDGTDCFERFDPSSTGPDIMPWAEWDYFEVFNDSARLKRVFPVLLGYHEWYKTYRSWPDGTYFSSGWGCGMDNQPRVPQGFDPRWSHAHMSWIDITLQQVYSGSILVKMARSLNRSDDVTMIETETLRLTDHLNRYMWDSQENFYFDRYNDGTLSGVKSIASFWALLAGVIPDTSAGRFIKHLEDKSEFDRLHRVPSLSADNPDYDPSGGYWKGAVWAPTNYMVLKGLTRYGYDSLAHAIALNHLNNVVEVFNLTNDIRENYSPDMVQGNNGRNFVGWTGLVPVNVLLEHVFGLRPDVPGNTLTVDVRLTDEYGITRYPFGRTGCLAIHCRKRKSISVKPRVSVETNVPLKIIIKWNDGALVRTIGPGTHHLH